MPFDGFRAVFNQLVSQEKETREHVEVCPDAGVIAQQLAQRLEEDGGIALIADYGHTGDKTDTFRVSLRHSEASG